MNARGPIKIALVHDWLTGMRGGEYVLEGIAALFPDAELFTLIQVPGKISPALARLKTHTSFLQKFPDAEHRYRHFLPLMPRAIESFDLTGFELVISSSHCVAKGVRKAPGAVHVSYIHAPMRYIWDRYDEYFGPGKASLPVRLAAKILRPRLQAWDRATSSVENVDALISNSRFISEQVHSAYGRTSTVIYPFADLSRFTLPRVPGPNYLMVTALAPYKRVDLAIEAFNQLKLPLLIVGGGQEDERVRKLAGPTVQFLGALSNAAIAELYSKCRAFVFPGKEDFGITPLEAMASGAPVIAFGEGGASETVTDGTGVFFRPQTSDALMAAVTKIENGTVNISEAQCRARASEFTRERFQREFAAVVRGAWVKAGKDAALLDEKLKF